MILHFHGLPVLQFPDNLLVHSSAWAKPQAARAINCPNRTKHSTTWRHKFPKVDSLTSASVALRHDLTFPWAASALIP